MSLATAAAGAAAAPTTTRRGSTFLGAIDQGTSSTRFILFDLHGQVVAAHQVEVPSAHPHPGWCEQDLCALTASVHQCIHHALVDFHALGHATADIGAIGITNQRETTCVWEARSGRPLHPALVWLDTRTKGVVEELVAACAGDRYAYQARTGLPLSTYFSGVKLRWLLDQVPAVRHAARTHTLRFGTVDSWLLHQLTGGAVHATDVTNASRTMLMDLRTQAWSEEMLRVFGVPASALPEIRSSAEVYGVVREGPLAGIPIAGCLGDQQAALVGQKCFAPGSVKNTYGTGCFMLMNTGQEPVRSTHGLLTTVAYKMGPQEPTTFALEGSVAIAGAAVKWLRDNLGLITRSGEISELAAQVPDTGGVYFVPALSGLFAPHWREDARGCIVGLTQHTTKHHLARATLEAVALQTRELLDAMHQDAAETAIPSMRVDGGLTVSDVLMDIQAGILGMEVHRPVMRETTALGAALAAGVGVGVWEGGSAGLERHFHPKLGHDVFAPPPGHAEVGAEKLRQWKRAVSRSLGWLEQAP